MDWVSQSIMARRVQAQGRAGALHAPTEAVRGEFQYVYGPYAPPVLRVAPGDTLEVETRYAFNGAIRTEADMPSAVLNMPYVNPQNGPIAVTGAAKGDTLAVHVRSIVPRGPHIIPEFGGLVATPQTAMRRSPSW